MEGSSAPKHSSFNVTGTIDWGPRPSIDAGMSRRIVHPPSRIYGLSAAVSAVSGPSPGVPADHHSGRRVANVSGTHGEIAVPGRAYDAVIGWWEYQRLMRGSVEQRRALEAGHPARTYQSWIVVARRINMGGLAALDLVLEIIDAAPSDSDIDLVGTGPLEDLVRKHGNTIADEIAELASQNARFARALTNVVARGVLSGYATHCLSRWIA